MERSRYILLIGVLFLLNIKESFQDTDNSLEDYMKPKDLQQLMLFINKTTTQPSSNSDPVESPNDEDYFGLSSMWRKFKNFFSSKPDSPVITHFYFYSRNKRTGVQVWKKNFNHSTVDFKPNRKTVLIIHGFWSYSKASWVNNMVEAFLTWADVNVIAVDWSEGCNTLKYWKAAENTRIAGAEIAEFMKLLMKGYGAKTTDMHFVGHSLGAHIAAFASFRLGKVNRITGLDPAQPCFETNNYTERLDSSDAEYVDIIHTNARGLLKFGFGFPHPIGHADFYPNGGMKQPGCYEGVSKYSRPNRSVCSHGRAYLLFTESLINKNCSFKANKWDLTYEGANASLIGACNRKNLYPEMGINAIGPNGVPRANGTYLLLTTDKEPFCPTKEERCFPEAYTHLLSDLKEGFSLDRKTVLPGPLSRMLRFVC